MKLAVFGLLALAACASRAPKPTLDLGPVPEGVSVDAKIQYYDMTAASLGELRLRMRQAGPKWQGSSWSALTTSEFSWTYKQARDSTSCQIVQAHVQMRTVVVFPRWTPSAEPDSALVEWWRQLNSGLITHEKGHALISLKTAGDIVRDLDKLSSGCGDLGRTATIRAQRLIQESRTKQSEYDATTRHGALQIQQAGRLQEP